MMDDPRTPTEHPEAHAAPPSAAPTEHPEAYEPVTIPSESAQATPGPAEHREAREPRAPKKKSHLWLWLLLIVLVVAVVLFYRHEEAPKKPAPAPTKIAITTVTATKGNIGVYLESIGTVTPEYTDSITSQVNGLVIAVHFKEGQLIAKDDPLVDIDPRTYRATLLQAQGALERDQNVLAQAQMDLERYRAAWSRNAIAKQILDDQEKLVLQDEGAVKNDQGTVQFDQVQLDYCHITSPIAGQVGLRLVDPGNVVQSASGVTLAVITQLDPITVILTIPEDNLGPVATRLRQGATLTVDAFDRTAQTKVASGKLLTLDNQIDTTTGTVKGRAVFENKNHALFPNQFVNTRLLVNTLQGVTLVPASAIQQNGQASFAYVIQDNVAHMRSIKPGVTDGGMTQVEGINPGDVLANSSFDKLQDNAAVMVVQPGAAGATGSTGGTGRKGGTGSKGK
jgi:multidrug efflux system membrane fusion protein